MNRAATLTCLALTLCAGQGTSQTTPSAPKPKSVKELVTFVKAREEAVKRVYIEMETEGLLPDGMRFKTAGTMRVLGKTHFHSRMQVHFGEDLVAETETVKTPRGVWTREKDSIQGSVTTHMKPELLAQLESASRFLDKDAGLPGLGGKAQGPLGSAMIEDLNRQFDLALTGPEVVDKQTCWVVTGMLRKGQSPAEGLPPQLAPDQVEIAIRTLDLAVVRMTQLRAGKAMTTVRIKKIELDRPMDKNSFGLKQGDTVTPIDVMEHPPAREQILSVLQDARDKGWIDGRSAAAGREDSKEPEPAAKKKN